MNGEKTYAINHVISWLDSVAEAVAKLDTNGEAQTRIYNVLAKIHEKVKSHQTNKPEYLFLEPSKKKMKQVVSQNPPQNLLHNEEDAVATNSNEATFVIENQASKKIQALNGPQQNSFSLFSRNQHIQNDLNSQNVGRICRFIFFLNKTYPQNVKEIIITEKEDSDNRMTIELNFEKMLETDFMSIPKQLKNLYKEAIENQDKPYSLSIKENSEKEKVILFIIKKDDLLSILMNLSKSNEQTVQETKISLETIGSSTSATNKRKNIVSKEDEKYIRTCESLKVIKSTKDTDEIMDCLDKLLFKDGNLNLLSERTTQKGIEQNNLYYTFTPEGLTKIRYPFHYEEVNEANNKHLMFKKNTDGSKTKRSQEEFEEMCRSLLTREKIAECQKEADKDYDNFVKWVMVVADEIQQAIQ